MYCSFTVGFWYFFGKFKYLYHAKQAYFIDKTELPAKNIKLKQHKKKTMFSRSQYWCLPLGTKILEVSDLMSILFF
jgi:hypothetical protein